MSESLITLPSGLRLVGESMPASRSVAVGAWVATGGRDDPAERVGAHHFLEHLVFKGAGGRSGTEMSRSIDRVGGDINAHTAKEWTAYYCRVPARHADLAVDVIAGLVAEPLLDADDAESERQVILDELAMDNDSPDDVVARTLAGDLFEGHPLGWDTAGEEASVVATSVDDLRRLHHERYRAASTVVSVAGAVDLDAVLARAAARFALPDGAAPAARSVPAPHAGARCLHVDDDTEQVHVSIGGRGLARHDPDAAALDVIDHVLGGGLSSRLFDEVRERRGLAYSVFSAAQAYSDAGWWSVSAATLPEHADEVHAVLTAELDRLVADGISDDELATAVGYLTGSYELALEDVGARMARLATQLVVHGEVRDVDTELARWQAVDHAAVRRVLDRVYAGERTVVTLGPS